MAKIKIFQVSGTPRTPGTPDVSGALIPLSAATQFGRGVTSFGKAVEAAEAGCSTGGQGRAALGMMVCLLLALLGIRRESSRA